MSFRTERAADPQATAKIFATRYDLWKWFIKHFPPPRVPHERARQGPGLGAIVQLASGSLDVFGYAGATDVSGHVYDALGGM